MTVQEVVDNCRDDLSEPQIDGFFTNPLMLGLVNRAIKRKVIPKLWSVGKYLYFGDLVQREVGLSLTEESDDNFYYDVSGLTYTSYIPSVNAWTDDKPVIFLDYNQFYNMRGVALGSIGGKYIGAIKGNKVYIYSPNKSTVDIMYVKIPDDYSLANTVEFADYIIEGLLVPIVCYMAELRDKGIIMGSIFRAEYIDFLQDLSISAISKQRALAQIPIDTGYSQVKGVGKSV